MVRQSRWSGRDCILGKDQSILRIAARPSRMSASLGAGRSSNDVCDHGLWWEKAGRSDGPAFLVALCCSLLAVIWLQALR
jgi:hypothetical protein